MATVLLVEPNDHLRTVFRRMFARAGFALIEAVDCEAAVGAAHDQRPDLVVVEGSVRDARGQDLPLRLAHDAELKRVPVIVLVTRQRDGAVRDEESMREVVGDCFKDTAIGVEREHCRQLEHPFRPRRLIELAEGTLGTGERYDAAQG